jgi:RimJ/RimL family protein N-acetyltransferase
VDLLIGDRAFVKRGIGRCALQLLTETLRARGDVSLLALTTSVHNHTARRAFEAAGFRVLRQYARSDYGLCYLMVLQLCTHGGSASEKA